jgi:hypothetical protein
MEMKELGPRTYQNHSHQTYCPFFFHFTKSDPKFHFSLKNLTHASPHSSPFIVLCSSLHTHPSPNFQFVQFCLNCWNSWLVERLDLTITPISNRNPNSLDFDSSLRIYLCIHLFLYQVCYLLNRFHFIFNYFHMRWIIEYDYDSLVIQWIIYFPVQAKQR